MGLDKLLAGRVAGVHKVNVSKSNKPVCGGFCLPPGSMLGTAVSVVPVASWKHLPTTDARHSYGIGEGHWGTLGSTEGLSSRVQYL